MKENIQLGNELKYSYENEITVKLINTKTNKVDQEFVVNNSVNKLMMDMYLYLYSTFPFLAQNIHSGADYLFIPFINRLSLINSSKTSDEIIKKQNVEVAKTYNVTSCEVPTSQKKYNEVKNGKIKTTYSFQIPNTTLNNQDYNGIMFKCLSTELSQLSQNTQLPLVSSTQVCGNKFVGIEVPSPLPTQNIQPISQYSTTIATVTRYTIFKLSNSTILYLVDILKSEVVQKLGSWSIINIYTSGQRLTFYTAFLLHRVSENQFHEFSFYYQGQKQLKTFSIEKSLYTKDGTIYVQNPKFFVSFILNGIKHYIRYDNCSGAYASSYTTAVNLGYTGPKMLPDSRSVYVYFKVYPESEDGKVYYENTFNYFPVTQEILDYGKSIFQDNYSSVIDAVSVKKLSTVSCFSNSLGITCAQMSVWSGGAEYEQQWVISLGDNTEHFQSTFSAEMRKNSETDSTLFTLSSNSSETLNIAPNFTDSYILGAKFPQTIRKTNEQILRIDYEITLDISEWLNVYKRFYAIE